MNKEKIQIGIEGTSKSTKFIIANVIKKALTDAGFADVDFVSESFEGVSIANTSKFISGMRDNVSSVFQGESTEGSIVFQASIAIHDKYPELVLRNRNYNRMHYVLRDEQHDLLDK